jgi:hypothetical protein
VDAILFKLVVTPVLILAASLAGRRWGEAVGGWFVGLPLTSGPVCLFIAIEQGQRFAAITALGSLAGVGAEAGFCLAYSIIARRAAWPAALGAASAAYAIGGILSASVGLPMWPLLGAVIAVLIVVLLLIPAAKMPVRVRVTPPRWDLPARMVIAGALVLGLTEAAPYVGPQLSGVLATYPIFAAVLTAFAHHHGDAASANRVLRGLLMGLFSFSAFFVVLAITIVPAGIAASFAGALATALVVQGGSLWLLGRGSRSRVVRSARALDEDGAAG